MSELAGARFQQLVEIMRTLRSEHGCAWDRQQTLKTLRPFVLQETYELLDALDRGDHDALEHELGDFLFEAVFLAQICEEEGRFSIADSIKSIADKLVRRHPHIFDADGKASLTPKQVKQQWEEIKAKERTGRRRAGEDGAERRAALDAVTAARLRAQHARRAGGLRLGEDRRRDRQGRGRDPRAARGGGGAEARRRGKRKRSSVTCCSRSSTSRGSWASSPRPRCAWRTTSSNGGSTISNARSRRGNKVRDLTLEQLEEHWQTAKATTKDAKG